MSTLRRALLAIKEALPEYDQWDIVVFNTSTEVTLGNHLLAEIQNNVPSTSYAIGIVDNDYSDVSALPASTATNFIYNGTTGYYYRIYNGGFDIQQNRAMTSTYACKIPQGTEIGVIYLK